MKKYISILLIIFCNILILQKTVAQDIHFSQFFETPLLRNPALAGLFSGDMRFQAVFRNQWQSVTTPYKTVSFNGEFKKPIGNANDFLTIGGQILYDKAGTIAMTATHLLPTLNYHKSLSSEKNKYLSLGFMAGYVQRRIDQSKITTNSQFDGIRYNSNLANGESYTNTSYGYFDASVGMSFNTQLGENQDNNLFVGVAYHHLNKAPKISFYSNPAYEMVPKWVGSAGLRMNATENSYITFEADYTAQKTYTETIAGFLYSYKLDDPEDPKLLIHGGVLIRLKDAIIPVLKVEKKPISLSVSYDVNISQLNPASQSRGGFEISLTYQKYIKNDSKYSSREAVRCPRF